MNLFELLKDEKINYALLELLKNVDAKDNDDYIPHIVKFANEHGVKVNHDEVKAFLAKLPISEADLDKVAGGRLADIENAISDATKKGPLELMARLRALSSVDILDCWDNDRIKDPKSL